MSLLRTRHARKRAKLTAVLEDGSLAQPAAVGFQLLRFDALNRDEATRVNILEAHFVGRSLFC